VAVAALAAAGALGPLALSSAGAAPTTNVTTYDYSSARTGDAPTQAAVTSLAARATWDATLDGAVYGEPLVYDGQVIVATERDSVYALALATGAVRWRLHVGTAVRTSVIDEATGLSPGCGDINPLGITGTPVIDPSSGVLYVAEETMLGAARWQDVRHDLVAISLATHRVLWRRGIDPPGGDRSGGYTIAAEQQRPALTLANGRVYVGFGGLAGDCGEYHGFEVAVGTSGRGAELVYQVPSAREAAIWETNGAVVSPGGDLFVATGNGASTTSFDGGNAVIELSPTLHVLAQWAPKDWATLSSYDWDLGSSGPIYVPGTNDLFIAGKPANGSFGFVVSAGDLGTGPADPLATGDVCASSDAGDFGADASAVVTVGSSTETFVYAACGGGTAGLRFDTASSPPSFTRAWTPSTGAPNGPPIVAGGLVWSLDWDDGALYAMAPATGVVRFSRVTAPLNHFATPTLADGFVLVPTRGGVEAFAAGS
jgi:outer membrane protein assembly factor BamB